MQSSLKDWVNIIRSKVAECDLRRKLYVQLFFSFAAVVPDGGLQVAVPK